MPYSPLSKEFLLRRGYCCYSGCLNCPYGFHENPPDPYADLPVVTEDKTDLEVNANANSDSLDIDSLEFEEETDKQ
jgi:hypothetical protein